ncbi:hypothetical protein GCM10027079_33570 [Sediminivirga luteola]|uniref:LTD domain-containing protein n=2 Tax=Sediminivirga luteola TaxID=1774748 RepID=A0A8J2XKG2_9MICO|nr:hypothetical protein GCM10011333_16490 [Sediminivirga luteola]
MTRMRTRVAAGAVAAIGALLASSGVAGMAMASEAPGELPPIAVNEVETDEDWIEITNTGDQPVDVSGWVVKDDNDTRTLAFPEGSVVEPGGFLSILTGEGDAGFGLGANDEARIFLPDGATLVDEFAWTGHPATSYGRCPDGTGEFVVTAEPTRDAANACAAPVAESLVLNEISTAEDWVELGSTATVPVDASGLILAAADGSWSQSLPAGSELAAEGHYVLDAELPGSGGVRLLEADGETVIDAFDWTEAAETSYGRCTDRFGEFSVTAAATRGTANDCAPPAAAEALVINEVESNNDDTDWVELFHIGDEPVDISGYIFRDDNDNRGYTLPEGSIVEPGDFFVIDQAQGVRPGFDFGLGANDEVRLFAPDGATLIVEYSWTEHAAVTYGRCPDGTGEMQDTTVSTKGGPNDCSTPLRINEVDGKDGGFTELINVGVEDVDAGGMTLRTAAGQETALSGTLAPEEYLVVEELAFQDADGIALLEADGNEIDSYDWTGHAQTSYGRCPDGRGEFEVTAEATPGAGNLCEGVTPVSPWPGGEEVVILDEEDDFEGDLSGLIYEPGENGELGTIWAVENGNSLLFKILPDGNGGWSPDVDEEWAGGLTLRYPDGTGAPDSEGVTLTDAGAAGGVYVGTERNNAESSVSRPSVLRYDISDTSGELVATDEWNLAEDFPNLGANLGIEGITWIPDSWLTGQGFLDESTGAAYDPAAYSGHGGGLFFVGFEGTAAVYAYALFDDGSFHRVAEIQSSFDIVAEVQFDRDRDVLWVICDDTCQGRTATFEVDEAGVFAETAVYARPAGMPDLNNEGFTFLDASQCVDGRVQTFYSDDNDTDGFSLRSGTLNCALQADPDPSDPDPSDPGADPEPGPTEPGADPEPTQPGTEPNEPGADPGDAAQPGGGSGQQPSGSDDRASGGGTLPRTGAEFAGLALLALALMGAGTAALRTARRQNGQ